MKGLSSEVDRLGMLFLVQTQEMGGGSGIIETLVYHSGRLVYSRKTPFPRTLQDSAEESRLTRLIEEKHKEIMKELMAGSLDHHLPGARK